MPRTKISEFSATPASNTDIDSIFIGEGMAPSNVNDAIRELMAQLKDFQVGSAGDPVTVGGVLTVQAGAVGTPAITTAGDTNTGMFFPAADTIAFAEGGAEVARFNSSGNLGLGVTPAAWSSGYKAIQTQGGALNSGATSQLDLSQNFSNVGGTNIYTTTNPASLYRQSSGQHQWYYAASGTAGNAITFTQAMTLDASGNLYLGATTGARGGSTTRQLVKLGTGQAYLEIQSASTSSTSDAIMFSDGSTGNYGLVGYDHSNDAMNFYTAATERARIDSSGNLLVGTTSAIFNERLNVTKAINAGYGVAVFNNTNNATGDQLIRGLLGGNCNNTGSYLFVGTVGSVDRVFIYGNGNIVNSNNSYGALSDIKLKENVTDATPKLEKLNQVRVVNYNLIGEEQKQLGVIAQELEQIFPSMIDETPDRDAEGNDLGTTTKSVKYSVFVPMLIKAMQEQQAIIESLKARLDAANL
jgi:hypothetical protein